MKVIILKYIQKIFYIKTYFLGVKTLGDSYLTWREGNAFSDCYTTYNLSLTKEGGGEDKKHS